MKSSPRFLLGLLGALLLAACGKNEDGSYFGAGGAGGGGGSTIGGSGGFLDVPLEVTAVAVGASHSCAVDLGSGVVCWGSGARGQLGDGTSGKDHYRAAPGAVPGLGDVVGLRAGGDTTCAILGDGTVKCWGEGAFGQLGDGVAADGHHSPLPVSVVDLAGVRDLAVTAQTACAVLDDGTVRCWGRNSPDEWLGFASAECGPYSVIIGDNGPTLMTFPCEPKPRVVPDASGARAVAAGGEHTCVLDAAGSARCWGADHFGQLGDGNSGPDAFSGAPVAVLQLEGASRMALGTSHTCAVAGPEARVSCWGDNSYGQLGIGSSALDSYKITPADVASLDDIRDLSASEHTTCAVAGDGGVLCWGDTETLLPEPSAKGIDIVPTQVPSLVDAVAVRVGGGHACAQRSDSTVVCWGNNDRGQLGNGSVGVADFSMMLVAAQPAGPN